MEVSTAEAHRAPLYTIRGSFATDWSMSRWDVHVLRDALYDLGTAGSPCRRGQQKTERARACRRVETDIRSSSPSTNTWRISRWTRPT